MNRRQFTLHLFYAFIMSLRDDVADVLLEADAGQGSLTNSSTANVVTLALQEVNTFL